MPLRHIYEKVAKVSADGLEFTLADGTKFQHIDALSGRNWSLEIDDRVLIDFDYEGDMGSDYATVSGFRDGSLIALPIDLPLGNIQTA